MSYLDNPITEEQADAYWEECLKQAARRYHVSKHLLVQICKDLKAAKAELARVDNMVTYEYCREQLLAYHDFVLDSGDTF